MQVSIQRRQEDRVEPNRLYYLRHRTEILAKKRERYKEAARQWWQKGGKQVE